ncbi:hypothetical protein C8J57DRAFT_1505203 [Mycena rebaudengoi]|nr:hypothetical protein C8J57DRAFT_1505203 [Mycena rebaudengoi]
MSINSCAPLPLDIHHPDPFHARPSAIILAEGPQVSDHSETPYKSRGKLRNVVVSSLQPTDLTHTQHALPLVSLAFMVATAAAADLKSVVMRPALKLVLLAAPPGNSYPNTIVTRAPQGTFAQAEPKVPSNTGKTSCIGTLPGNYQPEKGKTVSVLCPLGTYQTYANKGFCYGASSGRFQSKTGQTGSCGVCCGWYTTQTNNFQIYKCPAGTSSGRGSGSGCTSQGVGCVKAETCDQAADGTCPDYSYYG